MYHHGNMQTNKLTKIIILVSLFKYATPQGGGGGVQLDLGKVHPSLNLDGKKNVKPIKQETTTPQQTTTPSSQRTTETTNINNTLTTNPQRVINITVFGFAQCGSNDYCSNNGVCLVKLSNFTHKKCTCHKEWEGLRCEVKKGEKPHHEVMASNYVVYAIGILGGLLFLAIVAGAFRFYKVSENKKRRKFINKLKAKPEVTISFSNDDFGNGYKNPSYETDLTSQTDSSESASKFGTVNSNRVFHFNLNNNDKKEKRISDHVIVEVDNNNSQLASSVDSGNPLSEADETDTSSDVFASDRVTVTDRSDSPASDESGPKHKQSMEDIYNEYYSRRLSYQMEMKEMEQRHRKSVDMEVVSSGYNPYLYYTTPTRGRNNKTGRKVEQTFSTQSKQNLKKVKANARTGGRQRKMSEDMLRNNRPTILPPKITAMRSSSLSDLTEVGATNTDYPYHNRSINDLSTFGSTTNISGGRKISQTALISPTKKQKGIWASTFERQ